MLLSARPETPTTARSAPRSPPTPRASTYQGFSDVTEIVRAAGAGEYGVANVQAARAQRRPGRGWTFVVMVPATGPRPSNLSVFDGLQQVGSSSPA